VEQKDTFLRKSASGYATSWALLPSSLHNLTISGKQKINFLIKTDLFSAQFA